MHIVGARETLAKFSALPKEATEAISARSWELAQELAGKVRTAAQEDNSQTALMAGSVKAVRGKLPTIQAGGTARVGSRRKPRYKVLFGTEFGSNLKQFRPHRGRNSYWFFKTVYDDQKDISDKWNAAADDIIRTFGVGGRI